MPDKQAEAEVLAEVREVNLKKLATKEDLFHLEAATKEDLHRMEVGHRDKEAGKVYFRSMSEKLPALSACRSEEPCESPFAYAHVILTKQAYIQLKWDANYWRAEWQQVRVREQEALQRVAELKAQ